MLYAVLAIVGLVLLLLLLLLLLRRPIGRAVASLQKQATIIDVPATSS